MKKMQLIVLLFICLCVTSCTSIQSGFCKIRGGEPYVNLGGYEFCGEKYSDGGKQCYSSQECEGECVLPETWNPDEGKEVVGRCTSDNTWDIGYGCLVIEDYKHTSMCVIE